MADAREIDRLVLSLQTSASVIRNHEQYTDNSARIAADELDEAADMLAALRADALPGQGDGLRERVLEEAAQAVEKTHLPLLAGWRASAAATIRALSRPQASAPLTDGTPSEEEVKAFVTTFAALSTMGLWGSHVRIALTAAYAVRDRKPEPGA